MQDSDYNRVNPHNHDAPSREWVIDTAEKRLPKLINAIIEAQKTPERVVHGSEELQHVALHNEAQKLVVTLGKATAGNNAYTVVEEMIAAQKAHVPFLGYD